MNNFFTIIKKFLLSIYFLFLLIITFIGLSYGVILLDTFFDVLFSVGINYIFTTPGYIKYICLWGILILAFFTVIGFFSFQSFKHCYILFNSDKIKIANVIGLFYIFAGIALTIVLLVLMIATDPPLTNSANLSLG